MKKFYYAFLSLVMFASCSEEEMGGNMPESKPEMIRVSFDIASGEEEKEEDPNTDAAPASVSQYEKNGYINSRIWYDKNDQNKFDLSWNTGDLVTLMTDQFREEDKIGSSEVTNTGDRTSVEGKLNKWSEDETRTLYAIYPHREDYYNFDGSKFQYKAEWQRINVQPKGTDCHLSNSNAMGNAVMIAMEKEVGLVGEELQVERLFFKQVMSFLRFEITGLKEAGYKLKDVSIVDVDKTLVSAANIYYNNEGEIGYGDQVFCKKLKVSVDGHTRGDDAVVDFALIPCELKDSKLVVRVSDGTGNRYRFTKLLPYDLKFERNVFNFYPTSLDLNNDFEKEQYRSMDDFNNMTSLPADGEVVVGATDLNANTSGLEKLKDLIADADAPISLSFPDLETMTGNTLFRDVDNLKSVDIPLVTEIGDRTFQFCHQLTEVRMPSLQKAGIWTFDDDSFPFHMGLPDVNFIVATDPGIKFQYGMDGTKEGGNYRNDRLNIQIGNKSEYEYQESDGGYIKFQDGEEKNTYHLQYFKNVAFLN